MIQIIGGPRDGEWEKDHGPIFREPVPKQATYAPPSTDLPATVSYEVRSYRKEKWVAEFLDGKHETRWCYVLDGYRPPSEKSDARL